MENTMTDVIQGQKFKDIADFIYAPPVKLEGDYDNLANTFDTALLEDVNIIYTHTMYVKQLFGIIEELPQRFVVITHNSDVNIDNSFSVPDNVIKWFSQNVNVIHEKIESIPIGLENDMWFKNVRKKEKMIAKLQQPRNYRNLVYMNFNIANNYAKRQPAYDALKDKPWVTVDMHPKEYDFNNYIDNIYNHKFVVCPEGNGIDTHRIWECLYMGAIPLVCDNINRNFYYELPMIAVSSWERVTEDWCEHAYNDYKDLRGRNEWNMNALTFDYWKNKILSTL
jgi:hypothetical protein